VSILFRFLFGVELFGVPGASYAEQDRFLDEEEEDDEELDGAIADIFVKYVAVVDFALASSLADFSLVRRPSTAEIVAVIIAPALDFAFFPPNALVSSSSNAFIVLAAMDRLISWR
jgi:hypothetical protein